MNKLELDEIRWRYNRNLTDIGDIQALLSEIERLKAENAELLKTEPEKKATQYLHDCGLLPDHDGETYDRTKDKARLNSQFQDVRDLMTDGLWRTLEEIKAVTGHPTHSISARIRDLRKPKFGGYTVERRRRTKGTWEYRIGGRDEKEG